MYSNFEWPIPQCYELPQGEEFAGHEPAVVSLARGQKISGLLTRFLPTHGVVEFLPSKGRINLDLPLSDILELRLTRPLVLRPRRSEIEQRGGPSAHALEKLPFKVELTNGESLTGETFGLEIQGAGLFLYLANYGDSVLRSFIPAAAIKGQQIGKPLGEMLVDEKLLTDAQVRAGLARQKELREQKLGDLLAEHQVISEDQLHDALERQRAMPMVKLGDALVASKVITPEQLAVALERQKTNRRKPLGEILIEAHYLSKADLFRALSQKLGIPTVDLKKFRIDTAVLKLLPGSVVHQFNVLPLCIDGQALVVATDNPLDPAPVERIRFITQRPVTTVMASAEDIAEQIRAHFGERAGDKQIEELATQLSGEIALEAEDQPIKESDSTLVRLVNKMIIDAHLAGASDIHVETNPGHKKVRIRFRHDGALYNYLQLPASFSSAIVSRIKIMASLDISEKRRAQDGRINFQHFGPARVELRVATVPTLEGLEDVVLRVLTAGEPLPLDKLGLREPLRDAVRELLSKSFGLILVCGPTGSGKTTTLHSLLGVLNSPELKIWTAEDPIEISQEGLRQVQVNARIGWTFATAMRAFLRSDPDVIMVGEMRDAETASIAVEASLTGHLVLSTLHTNSAPETVVRLLEMGMDPYNFADSLAGVLAQRLARRLCPECKSSRAVSEQELLGLAEEYCHDTPIDPAAALTEWRERYGPESRLYASRGCDACKQSGYRGRTGLHELFVTTPDLRQLMQRRAPASELRSAAIRSGMRTLKQDGIEKCFLGLTDILEVRAMTA